MRHGAGRISPPSTYRYTIEMLHVYNSILLGCMGSGVRVEYH